MSNPDPPDRPPPPASDPVQDALHTTRDVVDTSRGMLDATQQVAGLARGATDPAALASTLGGAAPSATQFAPRALENVPGARQAMEAVSTITRTTGEVRRTVQEAQSVISGAMRAAGGVGRALGGDDRGGGDRLMPVQYTFTSRGTPDAPWRVIHVEAREALNELFRCVLDLATDALDDEADLDDLLARDATFVVARGEHTRRFCGVVAHVTYFGVHHGHLRCRVVLVPAFWTLGLNRDSKIYQDGTVPEILRAALTERLLVPREVRVLLTRTYPHREYCVQYRESDLAFAQRLMAEEGLAARLDCTGEKEVLVISDDGAAFPALATHDDAAVTLRAGAVDAAPEESLRRFGPERALQTTGVHVRDFDWTRPEMQLEQLASRADVRGLTWTAFEYPAPLTIGGYDAGPQAYQADDRAAQAELRRQVFATDLRPARGEGVVTGFAPGLTFQLRGHGRAAFNRRYVLTAVEHVGSTPWNDDESQPAGASGQPAYENRFTCLPSDVPYRPARPATRPTIAGAQTATVVGPPGEEIHTDHHGRIKVRFHWDREGTTVNDAKTCWVRVAQAWAGGGWGAQFIPRVGMEVIVTFLEGDPDRPLATACIYNGTHPVPYELPAHKTQSGIKTRSSPNSEGFNELRFEDAAGAEEVFLHAQKNLKEVVRWNHTTTVHANQDNTVAGLQRESVGGVQMLTVVRNRLKTVQGNEQARVERDRIETIGQNESRTVQGQSSVAVHGASTTSVGGNQTTTVGRDVDARVGGDATARVTGCATLIVGRPTACRSYVTHVEGSAQHSSSGPTEIRAEQELVLRCGESVIRMGRQRIEISAPTVVVDGAGSRVAASARGVRVRSDAPVVMRAARVVARSEGGASLNLGSEAQLTGPHVRLGGAGAATDTGPQDEPTVTRIELVDERGTPIPNQPYRVVLEDGSVRSGVLDAQGRAEIDLEAPGRIEFPGLEEAEAS